MMNLEGVVHALFIFLICIPLSQTYARPQTYTNPDDVLALNDLLYSHRVDPLKRDPCVDPSWQAVVSCDRSFRITAINMSNSNLGGRLSGTLGYFTSLAVLDLRNNDIHGPIPYDLPVTLRRFLISGNMISGTIPISLGRLIFLKDVSFSSNLLHGGLPNVFGNFTNLRSMGLSSNNFTGPLPDTFQKLSKLTKLYLQDNLLSGDLNVLKNLPLIDLNVENNLFSGSIPSKLLRIPKLKSDGNLLNSSTTWLSALALTPLPQAPNVAISPMNAVHTNLAASSRVKFIAAIIGLVSGFVVIVLLSVIMWRKNNKAVIPTQNIILKGSPELQLYGV